MGSTYSKKTKNHWVQLNPMLLLKLRHWVVVSSFSPRLLFGFGSLFFTALNYITLSLNVSWV
jgi:hypothetical protein